MKRERNHMVVTLLIPLVLAWAAICAAAENGGSGFSFGDAAARNEACLSCHGMRGKVKDSYLIDRTQYAHTTHANLGCSSCHGGVAATHPDGVKTPKADCRECHADVSQEYGRSIHAGKTGCAGCHNPHVVKAPVEISGEEINKICSRCHDGYEMTARHSEWLPQADLHLRMLPCITCHTASQEYFISMYIVKGKYGSRFGAPVLVDYAELKKLAGGKDILSLVDVNGDKYVSVEELRVFNANAARKLRLQGMMTPQAATHNFEILGNRRNCTFCHASGPARMQTSFLSLPEENGTFRRIPVEKGAVLDALYGTPDFYMMGSTKSQTLNVIGLAIVCGGLIMPVGHGSMRFLTRKNRKGKEHQS